ncbi:phosphatase PAP2 family protein [Actinoplanes auranticolor]|uniref:Phosphatidic acid phosphatase type 2/haloperoxidase domain-containing protein n=1 Tax=Actinoplanes auranticolor TaxID=47988 RepID=A0A919SIZ2_9ACTN|nr:phosphatase PAP2 family protein [Actinoplanes auranticolor]GIM71828.1 hypothetical protein Aau02nite_47920 [Actinoplanes auranticolor]
MAIGSEFERETVIDRVIAGMERKAAKRSSEQERVTVRHDPPAPAPAPHQVGVVPLRRPAGGPIWWLVAGAAAAFLLLTLAVVQRFGPLVQFDAWVSAGAYDAALAHPAWRSVMYAVTWTANTTTITPVAAVATLLLIWRHRWWQALMLVVAMLGTAGLRWLVLTSIDRPRPADRLAPSSGWSFPSGHTTASATAALVAVLICWPLLRAQWARVLLVAVAAGWALAVGISRVALVVHWPSDVVGGWLFVAVVVPSIAVLVRRLRW